MTDEELLIAVANTAHVEVDEFTDAGTVHAWWRELGASGGLPPAGPAGLDRLRAMRALVRGLALRNNGIGVELDTTVLDGLPLRPQLGTLSLRAATTGDLGDDICAAAVAALLRASARPAWPRLKACRGEDCRFVYVDQSRNCSRRWCDMAGCGNRAKSAAFRDRHRASGAGIVRP